MAAVMAGDASVSRRAAASRTRSRSPGSVSITMRSAVSRSASGMGPDRADGSGEFAAARDALAAAVVVHHLLLVLEQQPVELVGQQVDRRVHVDGAGVGVRSEEHTSELQSLMRISYAVFCLKKKKNKNTKR